MCQLFFVVAGVGLAQRCDHMILIGLFQLFGEVVVNGLLHSLQLPMAFGLILTVRLLALEMGFQVVRSLAGNAQGHFNCWLHLSVHYPGV